MSEFDETQLQKVREFLSEYFDGEELRTLCFDLGLAYEDLPGEGKAGKAREAVAYFHRRGRMSDLLQKLQEERSKQFNAAGLVVPMEGAKTTPFPESLTKTAPYPIAVVCARCNAARSEDEQFKALDRLVNNTVYYLTAIALSQYWQDKPDRGQLRAWLRELSHSRLTTSLTILNQVSDHYAAADEKPFLYPILFEPYLTPLGYVSPAMAAYRALSPLASDQSAQADQVTLRSFLSRLLEVREIHWESNPDEVDAALRERLLPALWPALVQLLDRFTKLLRYPLHYVERIDRDGEEWVYTMLAFTGAGEEPRVVRPFFREPAGEDPGHRAHYLYLCSLDRKLLLNLHPILVTYLYKLYFWECASETGKIWYRHCASAERLTPPEYYSTFGCSLVQQAEEGGAEDDPVAQLKKANTELEKQESEGRFEQMPLSVLLTYLSPEGRQALEIALGEALRIGHFWLGVEFLLMGLSKQDGRPCGDLLHELGASRGHFRGALRGMVGVVSKNDWRSANVAELGAQAFDKLQPADSATLATSFVADLTADEEHSPVVTPRMMQVLRDAAGIAGEGQIGHAHLLLAVLSHPQSLPVNLLLGQAVQAGWRPGDVPAWVAQQADLEPPELAPREAVPPPGSPPIRLARPDGTQPPPLKVRGVLATYGRDLTDLAQHGELRPAIGESAHKAMVQMGLILQQTQANNPILLGDPGVGKTAIVEGFAYRLATDPSVVSQLAGKRIVDLPPAALLAGTKYRGDLEERLQKLVAEVRQAAGSTIVFIDEIHTILSGRAEGGLGAIADGLKPALARGECPCIGATTVGEYRRHIEADPALARRFTPIWIEEPKVEEAIKIVEEVAQKHLGPDHGVAYPQAVIEEAVRLSVRYLHDEFLPGKAIKLLDQAGPRVVMGGSLSGKGEVDQDQPVGGEVTVEIVREIVSERAGVPLTHLSQDEKQRMLQLEDQLKKRVKGQDEAVREVARVVKRARTGLADPRRPLGVFLFAGPTGVGKTELGLALAEALFDEEDAILRLDMSEYMEKHQVSRLIGSPPGYVGYHEEGQLTGRLRRRPYSVVLLDEIEKAHDDVQHLFLQLFDAGRLTDARGNLADGRNAIFVMTTNLGAKVPLGFARAQMPSFAAQMRTAIEDHFTPEFLNRIDRIVYFEPLDEDTLLAIFDRQFEAVAARLGEQGIVVKVTEDFKRALCKRHTDETRGARPLQRAIEDKIVAPLTDKLLAGEITPGMKVVVGKDADMEVSETPKPPTSHTPTPPDPDARDKVKAQNEAIFDREFDGLAARLREREIETEMEEAAREFLCDPFWTETTLEQALVKLVEEPLLEQLEAGELQPGDHVRVEKYADHLEFKKVEGDEQ